MDTTKTWLSIFKLQSIPLECPVCMVPIIIEDIKEHSENYLIIYGIESGYDGKHVKRDTFFIYDKKGKKVICGSRGTDEYFSLIHEIISKYETTGQTQ